MNTVSVGKQQATVLVLLLGAVFASQAYAHAGTSHKNFKRLLPCIKLDTQLVCAGLCELAGMMGGALRGQHHNPHAPLMAPGHDGMDRPCGTQTETPWLQL